MRLLLFLFQFLFFTLQYQTAASSSSSSFPSSSPAHHQCSPDEISVLLQFKHMFSIKPSVSWVCDYYSPFQPSYPSQPSYPKTMSWNETNTDCCSWDGITCDRFTGQILELDLSCSQLYGTISPNSSLYSLTHLQRLNLAFNDFTHSSIPPSFGQFASLTHLNLSSSFSGRIPIEISHLSKLISLDLSSFDPRLTRPESFDPFLTRLEPHNFNVLLQNLTQLQILVLVHVNISSVVPSTLTNLSSLTDLDLSQTGLEGKLPDEIFLLPKLKSLFLGGNPDLTGYLPKEVNWSSSGSLSMLDVSGTSFSGELPDSISYLKSLTHLSLLGCKFSGSIPESLEKLKKLTYLNLRYNKFTGQFPGWMGNLTQLVYLDLSNNALTGPIPSSIRGLSNLRYLFSYSNGHNGTAPSWVFNLPSLMYLGLAGNRLTGQIPDFLSTSLYHVDLRDNELHGPVPPPPAIYFYISHNKFTGDLPSVICKVSSLEILDVSHNRLSGVIPQCFGNFSSALRVLNLGMNSFHGNIPTTFAEGNKLRSIALNGNQLEGPVPQSLANCRQLEVLDLGNNKVNDTFPYWLEALPELQVLVLKSNKFHGPVGTFKTKLPFPKLRIIDLSHNEFSGLLPTKYFKHFKAMRNLDQKVGKRYMGEPNYADSVTLVLKGLEIEFHRILTVFTTIDLSDNKFMGEIPKVVGKLHSLRLLNLSHNGLTGNIPSSLGNLCLLESLDLSSNQLSGKIPGQLTDLTFLEVLNLSQNHLEGPIPQGKQFGTFDNNSYDGNLGLCGLPLSKECGENEITKQPPLLLHQEEDSPFYSGFTWQVVVMGYGCGTIFGLVMGYLMFLTGKPKWFVRIVEGEQPVKAKISRGSGNRRGGRRN